MIIGENTIDGYPIKDLKPNSERKVNAICDICNKKLIIIWSNYTKSKNKRNKKFQNICRSCSCKITAKNRTNPPWNKGQLKEDRFRNIKPYLSPDGYKMIFNPNPKSRRGWGTYRKEHMIVMEEYLNRKLNKGEIIHHIDLNKTNNCLSNLYLTDSASHRHSHWSLQLKGKELIQKGLILFNRENGEYFFSDKMKEFIDGI